MTPTFPTRNRAPRRGAISPESEPARGPGDAIGAQGAKSYPDTGRPEHQLPFTAAGLKANLANRPAWGPRAVASAVSNDPQPTCEPRDGRASSQLPCGPDRSDPEAGPHPVRIQSEVAEHLDRRSREPEGGRFPRAAWWGYSVGRWTDDYTFVAETVGLDERTWLDNVGRPHSLEARIEERYVRRDAVHIDVTITIDDPVCYSSRGSRSTGSRCGCS